MRPEILTKESFIDAFDECAKSVGARKPSLDNKTVVIVPDRYTLFAERRLFLGGGAFDVEVVTFSRLLQKTGLRPKNALSKTGAIMLMRKLIGDGKDLECFRKSALFTGFASAIYETVAQLGASLVTPQMLDAAVTDEALKRKIRDLKTLQSRYIEATEGEYTDPSALLAALPGALKESGYLNGARVHIVNFDRFTAMHRLAIDAVCSVAESVRIYEAKVRTDSRLWKKAKIAVYRAPDAASQLKAVARTIRNEIIKHSVDPEPLRYRDICVVTAQADYGALSRIFSEYGIEFSSDEKYPLSLHPLPRFVFAALDAASESLKRVSVVKLAKCALSGVDYKDACIFENYCNERRVEYGGLRKKIEDDDTAERVRRAVVDGLILPLKQRLSARMSAEDFVAAVRSVTERAEGVPYPSSPYDLESFAHKFYEILELVQKVMAGKEYPLSLLAATLKEGVESRKLSYLPTYADSVAVGNAELFRGQRFRKIFVIGFNDGSLPPVTKDCGVITDAEIDALSPLGAKIEPKTADVNLRARSELLHLLGGCDDLFFAYDDSENGGGMSALMAAVLQNSECEKTTVCDDEESLSDRACSETAARELFADGMRRLSAPPYQSTLALVLKEKADDLLREDGDDFVLKKPYDIFFKKSTAYISQIQTFFSCPYRHFLQYGLGLKERADGTVDPRDVGTILHRVAERYVGAGNFASAETVSAALFEEVMAQDFPLFNLPSAALERLKRESVRMCVTISEQFGRSNYRALGQEVRFSPQSELRAPSLVLPSGKKLDVVGVIDRIDVCGKNRVRIIDYKSGFVGGATEALGAEKLYYGVKFQLQFYGAVMRANGYDVDGLFYFPIKNDWTGGDEYLRMVGVFDSDPSKIEDMDVSLENGGKSELFNVALGVRNGIKSVSKRNKAALSSRELSARCDYSFKVFESGVSEICDGLIRPMPYSEKRTTACSYCPYATVCVSFEKRQRTLGAVASAAISGDDAEASVGEGGAE